MSWLTLRHRVRRLERRLAPDAPMVEIDLGGVDDRARAAAHARAEKARRAGRQVITFIVRGIRREVEHG